MDKEQLRCATWNVHRAKGMDGKIDAARIVDTIAQDLNPLKLDILALQEADGECRPHARIFDVHQIARLSGLEYIHDPALVWGPQSDGFLGTILFMSSSLRRMHADVIDLPGHCHRGAISVEVVCGERPCRIISTHLSLTQPLRALQMRIIGQYMRRRPEMQTILLGDLNEWRPWGGAMLHSALVGTKLRGPAVATFPSNRPILPLDRILTDGAGVVETIRAVKTPRTRIASDHLPLEATVTVA